MPLIQIPWSVSQGSNETFIMEAQVFNDFVNDFHPFAPNILCNTEITTNCFETTLTKPAPCNNTVYNVATNYCFNANGQVEITFTPENWDWEDISHVAYRYRFSGNPHWTGIFTSAGPTAVVFDPVLFSSNCNGEFEIQAVVVCGCNDQPNFTQAGDPV